MDKEKLLSYYFYLFGLLSLTVISIGPYFLGDELLWQPRNLPTEIMMSSIYFSIGIVMILAAKAPTEHKLFVDFLILSNTIHAAIMIIFAQNVLQIIVDAGMIGVMGILPVVFYPWGLRNLFQPHVA
ncbi:MAG: hypothetical protein ACXABY_12210 [Candidatus Thorarchaeota archaeon]|jgi:hypothetical protein